jgi:hypothetical protein
MLLAGKIEEDSSTVEIQLLQRGFLVYLPFDELLVNW